MMKPFRNSLSRCIGMMLAACLALSPAPSGAESATLTIAADEWCPINCAPDATRQGIGLDLARQVFEPLGYEVRYVVMPWARALEEVRAGRVDAVVGANHSDDPSLILPHTPLYDISDDFYVLADNSLSFKSMQSLQGLRLGIIRDYGYATEIVDFLKKAQKTPGIVQETGGNDALEQNIRKLKAKRIDVIVESRPVMDYTLARLGLEEQIKWIGGIRQGNVYLAFSPALPESRQRARQFDEGAARLRNAGTLDSFYAAYGLKSP